MGSREDSLGITEAAHVGAGLRAFDTFRWKCDTRVEKYAVDDFHAGRPPLDIMEIAGNVLTIGGADVLWLGLTGALVGTTGSKKTRYDNANACILVGDSTVAAGSSQTDLQASSGGTHRWSQGMDATYPTHTTGVAASTATKILYKATLSSARGNFTNGIREWGIGNSISQVKPFPGRILNRKVTNLGTKTSAGIWAITITLSAA